MNKLISQNIKLGIWKQIPVAEHFMFNQKFVETHGFCHKFKYTIYALHRYLLTSNNFTYIIKLLQFSNYFTTIFVKYQTCFQI